MTSSREILKKLFQKELRWNIIYYLLGSGGLLGILFLFYYYKKNNPLRTDENKIVAKTSHNTLVGGNVCTVAVNLTGGNMNAPLISCNSQVEKKALPKIFQPQIPFLAESLFVERKALNQLKDILQPNDSKPRESPMVLTAYQGLGGVGKTQLALYYYYKSQKIYSFKCWFSAEQEDILDQQYREFCQEYSIPFDDKASPLNLEIQKKVKQFLENNPGWLLIYDNVRDSTMIGSYLPRTGGDIVLTSRHRFGWDQINGRAIEVRLLEKEEAIKLIKCAMSISGELPEEEKVSLNKLVHELGYLPLALAQAAAYINSCPAMTITAYLIKLQEVLVDTLDTPLNKNVYPQTLAKTWFITMEEIQRESPIALQVLQICAYLAPDGIPYRIAYEIFLKLTETLLEEKALNSDKDVQFNRKILGLLVSFSMVSYDKETKQINIHRLVQEVMRLEDNKSLTAKEIFTKRLKPLASFFIATYPSTKKTADFFNLRKIHPHIETVSSFLENLILQGLLDKAKDKDLFIEIKTIRADLLSLSGDFFVNVSCDAKKSLLYQEKVLVLVIELYGNQHSEVAIAYNNVGRAYIDMGCEKDAISYFNKALDIEKSIYGEEHLAVARSYNNLANAYLASDNPEKALELHLKALAIRLRLNNSIEIGTSYSNLGKTYYALQMYKDASEFHQKALEIKIKVQGEDHPSVAVSYSNLGCACQELGEKDKALEYQQKALTIKLKVYDEWHEEIAASYNNLGHAYRALGSEEALKCYEKALIIHSRTYGSSHPKIAGIYKNISNLYISSNPEIAREYLLKALAIYQQFDKQLDATKIERQLAELPSVGVTASTARFI